LLQDLVPAGPDATTFTDAVIPTDLTTKLPTGVETLVPVLEPNTLFVVPSDVAVAVMCRLPLGDQPELLPANCICQLCRPGGTAFTLRKAVQLPLVAAKAGVLGTATLAPAVRAELNSAIEISDLFLGRIMHAPNDRPLVGLRPRRASFAK
jgi:hypothetical protein